MRLEEYIAKRKREDGINEYDLDKRSENTRFCVNYIFEYFNNYLETRPADEKTILHEQKIEKYQTMMRDYDSEVREWLVSMYTSHGKYLHKQLANLIIDDYFLLYDSEAEFRALSYDIYPKAIKRLKFLAGHSEMVFQFIKDTHRIDSAFRSYEQDLHISEGINEWIFDTYRKYSINVYNFCKNWVNTFYSCPERWPKGHKTRSKYYERKSENARFKPNDSLFWDYDYKQKSNLFGLDALYRNMPKKSFTKGKKQEFEAILMYCWLSEITDDAEYWEEYSHSVL